MSTRKRPPLRHALALSPIAGTLLIPVPFAPGAAADTTSIYRSTAPDGTVRFSDQPAPEATLVTPRPLTVIPREVAEPHAMPDPPPLGVARSVASGSTAPPDSDAATPIERVAILSPPPEATLIDPNGPLLVEIGTSPGTLSGSDLRAEVLMDGETVASGRASALAVPSPERGAHEIEVRLVAADGRVHLRSEKQTLHVRRGSSPDVPAPRYPLMSDRTGDGR